MKNLEIQYILERLEGIQIDNEERKWVPHKKLFSNEWRKAN